MPHNRGRTSLICRRPSVAPMQAYDALPPELRAWVAQAALPWSARSVRAAYGKALAKSGDPSKALAKLDQLQQALLARDAKVVWSQEYPG